MPEEEKIIQMRNICWNRALQAFGTAYIFEKRANRLKWYLYVLTFLGIGVPVAVGGLILSFGTKSSYLPYFMNVAGVLVVVQLVASVWSLVNGWNDKLNYAYESMTSNHRLASSFKNLAQNPPGEYEKFKINYDLLNAQDEVIGTIDLKQGITEKERRKGMHAALREFQRKCSGCGEIPKSMETSKCPVCGNF